LGITTGRVRYVVIGSGFLACAAYAKVSLLCGCCALPRSPMATVGCSCCCQPVLASSRVVLARCWVFDKGNRAALGAGHIPGDPPGRQKGPRCDL
jgi:hypothetical protein